MRHNILNLFVYATGSQWCSIICQVIGSRGPRLQSPGALRRKGKETSTSGWGAQSQAGWEGISKWWNVKMVEFKLVVLTGDTTQYDIALRNQYTKKHCCVMGDMKKQNSCTIAQRHAWRTMLALWFYCGIIHCYTIHLSIIYRGSTNHSLLSYSCCIIHRRTIPYGTLHKTIPCIEYTMVSFTMTQFTTDRDNVQFIHHIAEYHASWYSSR